MGFFSGYQREEPESHEGKYRAYIKNAVETTSTKGNKMLVLDIVPNGIAKRDGSEFVIKYYITYGEYFNRNITSVSAHEE